MGVASLNPHPAEFRWHYTYDDLSRVNSACAQWNATTSACEGDAWTYTYDGAGNLLRFDKWSEGTITPTRFVYNGANQSQCIDADASGACDGTEFVWQYDAYGNLLNDGSSTYIYDAALRLSSVTNGEGTTTYQYNGDGDRVAQTVNGVQTTYVIDTATPLTMVLAETTGTDTIRYLHGLDLVAQSDGVSAEYFAYDGLGSVRQVLDAAGLPLMAQTFDPYGNPYSYAGPTESVTSFGYSGEQTDSNGLVFLRARYYDPKQGRFFQRDSWRGEPDHPLTLNPYMYGLGNPVLLTDPSGQCAACIAIAIAILAAATMIAIAASPAGDQLSADIAEGCSALERELERVFNPPGDTVVNQDISEMPIEASRRDTGTKPDEQPGPIAPGPQDPPRACGSGDPDCDDKETEWLYRSMEQDGSLPALGESATRLGVRIPPNPTSDVTLYSHTNGQQWVRADGKGMSTAPRPNLLPAHRRPPDWGGTSKVSLWCIRKNIIDVSPIIYANPDSPNHVSIAPRADMPYENYRQALEGTRRSWQSAPPAPLTCDQVYG